MAITLIAADPHPIYLLGLKQLFSTQSNLQLLACCATAQKVHEAVQRQQPDILVLDHTLPDDGFKLVRDLKHAGQSIKIVLLTEALDDEQTIEALKLEVHGVILKGMPMHMLLQCINKVAAGGQWLEKKSIGHAFDTMLRREAGARRMATILTERETEVMQLVAQGLSNKQIADKLIVSVGTVKIHVHNIYGKLGVNNRVDLTLYAQKRGMA